MFGAALLESELYLGRDCVLYQVSHTCGDDLGHLGDEFWGEPVLLLELANDFLDVVVETAH